MIFAVYDIDTKEVLELLVCGQESVEGNLSLKKTQGRRMVAIRTRLDLENHRYIVDDSNPTAVQISEIDA